MAALTSVTLMFNLREARALLDLLAETGFAPTDDIYEKLKSIEELLPQPAGNWSNEETICYNAY